MQGVERLRTDCKEEPGSCAAGRIAEGDEELAEEILWSLLGESRIVQKGRQIKMCIIQWFNDNQGFISALLALITAAGVIYVPMHIAHRQNSIALYKERYEAYSTLLRLKNFAQSIADYDFDSETSDVQRTLFFVHLENIIGPVDKRGHHTRFNSACSLLKNYETKLYTLPFLIAKGKVDLAECSAAVSDIFEPLFLLLTNVAYYPNVEGNPNGELHKFTEAVDAFSKRYSDKIEGLLLLHSKG